jgi:hypothetical protein
MPVRDSRTSAANGERAVAISPDEGQGHAGATSTL